MTGIEYNNKKYIDKIDRLVIENKDKPLKSFYNYMNTEGINELSSKYQYIRIIIDFLNYISKPLNEIIKQDYRDYLDSKSNNTSSYRIQVYCALKKFNGFLYENEMCKDNYMNSIKKPKKTEAIETVEKRRKGFLEEKEIYNCLNNIENGIGSDRAKARQKKWKERDKAIFVLFLHTGFRCSALCSLDIDSIDFENGHIVTIEKGGKVKEAYISEEAIEIILEWMEKRKELVSSEEKALFISGKGGRLSQSGISEVVEKYSSNIKGKHITPHKLRATYAMLQYNNTHDLYNTQILMGHKSPATTEIYLRYDTEEILKKAGNSMKSYV